MNTVGTKINQLFVWSIASIFLFSGLALGSVVGIQWERQQVKPVVMCRYDNFYGFIPVNSEASVTTPSWKKEQITPIVDCKYENFTFKPKNLDGLSPTWQENEVEPWVEVVYDSMGQFVIK